MQNKKPAGCAPAGSAPLKGTRVVELTRVIVGPYAARVLGACGATIVHVESGRRIDPMRTVVPYLNDIPGQNRSGYFNKYNSDKLSMALDITRPEGFAVMRRLVKWADVFIESNAPGVVARLKLDYESVRKLNESIIMVSTCQMGQKGPLSKFRAFGVQSSGMAGILQVTGYPDRDPSSPFAAYTDMVSPMWLAIAIMSGLDYRRRTGKGMYIDHSQIESGVTAISTAILDYNVNGRVAVRDGNRDPHMSPHGCYRCRGNDAWCTIAVPDDRWPAFRKALGGPGWTAEERFSSLEARKRNEDELDKLIEEWTLAREPRQVARGLLDCGVAAGIISSGADLYKDAQLAHRQHFKALEHPELGPVPFEDLPFRMRDSACRVSAPAPCIGEHTEFVCTKLLGMSDEEFMAVVNSGACE